MNNKDTGFQDLESGINSHNMSSGQLLELDQMGALSQRNRIALDPALEFTQSRPNDTIKQKRDIFDKLHYKALNTAHKIDVNEDDCHVSNQSAIKSDAHVSLSSISQKYTNPIQSKKHRASTKTINMRNFEKDDVILQSSPQISPYMNRTSYRLQQFQSFVQKLEKEQAKDQNEIQKTLPRNTTKQQSLIKQRGSKIAGLNGVWGTKSLNIIRLVSRFIQQLKTKTERVKFRLINKRIFQVIGDASADFNYILLSNWIKQKPSIIMVLENYIKSKFRRMIEVYNQFELYLESNVKVISPDNPLKITWDILLLLFITINIFYIPLQMSFELESNVLFVWLFETLPSYVFIVEILINFNTAYYDKGLMHQDRKQIIKHYVRGNLIWDLIVVIPFLLSYLDIPYIQYILLLRVTRISPLMTNIEDVLNLEEIFQICIDLFKLIFIILITAHFCGCAWHFLAVIEEQQGYTETWITKLEVGDYWFDRYIVSFYWSTITTLTIGYGDITPVTTVERVFVIFVALFICGVFGYCLSNIGNIFKQLADRKAAYKTKLKIIDQHIKKRGLSYQLQLKVKKYFEYYLALEQEENQHAEQYMSQLTNHLKQEVMTDLYGKILRNSRFLRENFLNETIDNLCLFIKEKKLLPEESLFQKSDQPKKLWFIVSGSVEYFADHENNDSIYMTETFLKKVSAEQVSGEREFITQNVYDYSARALKFTSVIYIEHEDFLKVLKDNDEEFEKFCMIRDNILFNATYKKFGTVCEICKWTHGFKQCPFVFLQPNKNKIATLFSKSKTNNRLHFPYRGQPKTNFRMNMGEIQESALGFIVVNNILSEKDLTDNYLIELGFKLNNEDDVFQNKVRITNVELAVSPQPAQLPLTQSRAVSPQALNDDIQKPHPSTSIQTVPLESKQGNMFREREHNSRIQQQNLSMEQIKEHKSDWDNSSNMRKSFGKINLDGLNRGRTIQSIKSKYAAHEYNHDDSMVQEETKIQNLQHNSFSVIQAKLKMKSKPQGPLRKVSWMNVTEANNNSPKDSQEEKQKQIRGRSGTKQQSKMSEYAQNQVHTQQDLYGDEIKQRIEAHETSLVQKIRLNDQYKRKKKRTKSQYLLNASIMSAIEPDVRSIRRSNPSSSVFTNQLVSQKYVEDKMETDQQNDSLLVGDSNQVVLGRVRDIVHNRKELELDAYQSSRIYFPEFNIENVIRKLNIYYEQVNQAIIDAEMQFMKRTKTNMTLFDRIKKNPTTYRTNVFEKSFQE